MPNRSRPTALAVAVAAMLLTAIGATPARAVTSFPAAPSSLSVVAEGAQVSRMAVATDGRQLLGGTLAAGDNVFEPAGAAVHVDGTAPYRAFLASLASDGSLEWVLRLPGATGNNGSRAVAVDAAGNAYVMARFSAAATVAPGFDITPVGSHDAYVAKFDTAGTATWVRTIESSSASNCCQVLSSDRIAFDGSGVVVAGPFNGDVALGASPTPLSRASTGGWDHVVAAFAPDGTTRWLAGAGTTGTDVSSVLVASPLGGTRLVFYSARPGGTTDTQVTSTATGTVLTIEEGRLWSIDLPDSGVPANPLALASWTSSLTAFHPSAVHVRSNGAMLVAGRQSGAVTYGAVAPTMTLPDGGALIRYTTPGRALWTTSAAGSSSSSIVDVAEVSGEFVFVGRSGEDPTREPWENPMGYGDSVGVRLNGDDAPIPGQPSVSDGFVGRVDDTGELDWVLPIDDDTCCLAVAPAGDLVLTGNTSLDTFTFGNPPNEQSVSFTGGVTGSYLARMPATGVSRSLPGCAPVAFVDPVTTELDVMATSGAMTTAAAAGATEVAPAWSRDRAQLAYVAPAGPGTFEVRVVDAAGSGSPVAVGSIASATTPDVRRLAFSPSGDWVSWEEPLGWLQVAPADGSTAPWTVSMVADAELVHDTVAWSHDDRIAWVADDGLHVAAADGSGPIVIAPAGAQVVNWSPDGETIYSFSAADRVYSVPSDGSAALTPHSGFTGPLYSIDDVMLSVGGDRLVVVFQPGTPGWRWIWVVAPDGGSQLPGEFAPFEANLAGDLWRLPNGDIGWRLLTSLVQTVGGFPPTDVLNRAVHIGALHGADLDIDEHLYDSDQTTTKPFPSPVVEPVPGYAPAGDHFFRDDELIDSHTSFPVLDLTSGSTSPAFAGELADLAVSVTPPAGPIEAYDSGQVTVTVTNTNAGACSSAVPMVDLTLGTGGLTIAGATPTQGTVDGTHWMVGDLAPGASAQLTLDLAVGDVPPGGLATTIDADVRSLSGGDPDPGDDNDQAAIDLDAVAGIRGVVTDETSGLPIAGAKVGLYSSTSSGRLATATTDAGGVYDFRPLAPGDYRLKLWDPAGTHVTEWHHDDTTWAAADDVTVVAEQMTVTDEALAGAGMIIGRVRNRTTTLPLDGATVTLYNASGGLVAVDTTSATGWYDFPALPAGTYKLKLTKSGYFTEWYQDQWLAAIATPLPLAAGQTLILDGYPAVAYLTSTANPELAGTVTETGTPLDAAVVRIYTASGQVASVATAADGTWSFGGLAKHTNYYLRFEHPGHTTEWWNDASTYATATPYSYNGTNPNLTVDAALAP